MFTNIPDFREITQILGRHFLTEGEYFKMGAISASIIDIHSDGGDIFKMRWISQVNPKLRWNYHPLSHPNGVDSWGVIPPKLEYDNKVITLI